MTTRELKKLYFNFFQSKGHAIIPSASLVPENDPSVLFTTAGMHPLVPYLLGEKHPQGTRLANAQKCIRTGDIDDVGDATHLTFFEMLGNWSLGDYGKKEAIEWSFEFLTKVLNIPLERLAVSVFAGDDDAPRDEEASGLWKSLGIPEERIAYLGKDDNWWPAGGKLPGPQGPDTEMFYWKDNSAPAPKSFDPHDKRWVEIWNDVFMMFEKKERVVLVDGMYCLYDESFKLNEDLLHVLNGFNNRKIVVVNGHAEKASVLVAAYGFEVFSFENEIKKEDHTFFSKLLEKYRLNPNEVVYVDHAEENLNGAKQVGIHNSLKFDQNITQVEEFIASKAGYYVQLKQQNVDTGMGLERTVAMLDGKQSVYEIDSIEPLVSFVKQNSKNWRDNEKSVNIVVDHIRAAVFMLADERGVKPSNVDQGYILRRLIRRAIRHMRTLGFDTDNITDLAQKVVHEHHYDYPEMARNHDVVMDELTKEKDKFLNTLEQGTKAFEKYAQSGAIAGKDAFTLFASYGFPLEMTQELAAEKGIGVDIEEFAQYMADHQEKSRTASAGKFKGGLADHSEMTVKYHTANHMMLEALKRVLGRDVVNQRGSNITAERLRFDFTAPGKMTPEQIKEVEDIVNAEIAKNHSVHFEEMSLEKAKELGATGVFDHKYGDTVKVYFVGDYSKEICGGPHVTNTAGMGKLKIQKEEASSAGIRRIKAILE